MRSIVSYPRRVLQVRRLAVHLVIASLLVSCGDDAEPTEPGAVGKPGPYVPAHTTVSILDAERELKVEVWYPGQGDQAQGEPAANFERDPERRSALADLLQAATPGCPTLTTQASRDAPALRTLGAMPLVVFSHCLNCGRYSAFSLAERLASHGMIVVAPDHAGPMPFADGQEGEALDAEQLERRVADLRFVITASLDGSLFALSSALDGLSVDAERIGAFGHSFGSATTGRLAQLDPRVGAAAGLAAPMASFLFPSVAMDAIDAPLLLVLAQEDNSITEIGNDLLRDNFADAVSPVWLLELADAGHWSISDLCGLTPNFTAGCGAGERHSRGQEGEAFSYLPVQQGIEVAQRYLATFFLAHLNADNDALYALQSPRIEAGVSLSGR